jgi:DnaJ domain
VCISARYINIEGSSIEQQALAMPAAAASGADAGPSGGTARSREHNQGNQDRKYTPEQKAAVIRIRKCSSTAYYEILALDKSSLDKSPSGEEMIKKAYRKLSLLTHPDKNGYEGADEAFKRESCEIGMPLQHTDSLTPFSRCSGLPSIVG